MLFLEKNPNEEFLKEEKKRILKIVTEKENQYNYWSSNICDKALM